MKTAILLAGVTLFSAATAAAFVVRCPDQIWAGNDPGSCPCCVVCSDGSWHVEGEGECAWPTSRVEEEAKTDESGESGEGMGAAAAVIILSFLSYFLPAVVASRRRHPQANPIFIINLLLGWTIIGWIVAMAWAVSAIPKRQ